MRMRRVTWPKVGGSQIIQAGRWHGLLANYCFATVIAAVRFKHVSLNSSTIKQVKMLCDDVINDVISPGSTMREDHICTPYKGTLY